MNSVDRIRAGQYDTVEHVNGAVIDGQSAEQILRSLDGRLTDRSVLSKLESAAARGRNAVSVLSISDMDIVSRVLRGR